MMSNATYTVTNLPIFSVFEEEHMVIHQKEDHS